MKSKAMKLRNIATAGMLAVALLGVSAASQLTVAAPGYAEETAAAGEAAVDERTQGPASLVEGSAEKTEVVYASMTTAGAVKNLYVVNELFSDAPALVKDFGAYTAAVNLTDESTLAHEPDSVVCAVEEESFVYQGNLASTDLPWNVRISYELDGEPIAAEDLAGRSGDLKISIETGQNAVVDPVYFDNYMLQITCTLPIAHATHIATEEGSIALAGSNTTVSFTVMPGKSGSYVLTAQVKDFEMEGISIAAIPFSMALDLPDTDSIVSQFDALIEGTSQLDTGAKQLEEGTTAFKDGVRSFDQGAGQLRDGAEELSTGVTAYVAGVAQVSQGLAQVAAGSSTFAGKLEELSQASAGIEQSLAATDQQIQDLIEQIQRSATLTPEQKAALIQQITGLSSQLGGLKDYVAGVGQLSEGYAQLDSSIAQLSAGLDELSAQGKQLAGGADKLDAGVGELAGSAGSLAQGAGQLADGTKSLSEGTAQLHEESKQIPDKVQAEIDAFVSDYDKSDFEPRSFVDARNTNVKLVQFVMTTEAIHVPDPEPEEPEVEDETLLSRFLALFS